MFYYHSGSITFAGNIFFYCYLNISFFFWYLSYYFNFTCSYCSITIFTYYYIFWIYF